MYLTEKQQAVFDRYIVSGTKGFTANDYKHLAAVKQNTLFLLEESENAKIIAALLRKKRSENMIQRKGKQ